MASNKIFIPTFISSVNYAPARVLPRIFFYNGVKTTDTYYIQGYTSGSTTVVTSEAFTNFPYFDNYEGNDPDENSRSLLFFNEPAVYGTTPSASLYSEYWSKYVELLYDPKTRLINCSAIIPLADYFKMELNDIVEWRGNYYHLRAINDYNLSNGECKLQLLGPLLFDVTVAPLAPECDFDVVVGTGSINPSAIPTATPTATPSPTIGLSLTPSPTPTRTVTSTPAASILPSTTPSLTPTVTPTATLPLGECYNVSNFSGTDAYVSYTERDGSTGCQFLLNFESINLCIKAGTNLSIIGNETGCGSGDIVILSVTSLGTNCLAASGCLVPSPTPSITATITPTITTTPTITPTATTSAIPPSPTRTPTVTPTVTRTPSTTPPPPPIQNLLLESCIGPGDANVAAYVDTTSTGTLNIGDVIFLSGGFGGYFCFTVANTTTVPIFNVTASAKYATCENCPEP